VGFCEAMMPSVPSAQCFETRSFISSLKFE
jgi:hypothetical protein